jgi:group II intron reverse transcriptase/maturase
MNLNKGASSGVDGQTWDSYNLNRERRIEELYRAFKEGSYRAPTIRRAYIPKGDGKKRPLGLPTVGDKLLQSAVANLLTPVYEQEFYDFSYGFRPGKSAHQALVKLFQEVSFKGKRYIIDADMKNYFGSINHQHLRELLDLRIKDGVIRKQIDKWLKAGILESGMVSYPKAGTPQGGSISPILSNIYLHYVLDKWFTEQIQGLLKGPSSLIRYADDFLLCFSNKGDAERVMRVLPRRLGRFGLSLHPEKTRLIDLNRRNKEDRRGFDFLGFTHYMSKSRKGKPVLKRKTSSKKLSMSLKKIKTWLKYNRHQRVKYLIHDLNLKLRGYYNYYGITFNSRSINSFYEQVKLTLFKWLNRRGGKRSWDWERFAKLINEWYPLLRPKINHRFRLAKP